jgi:hypothetical protein
MDRSIICAEIKKLFEAKPPSMPFAIAWASVARRLGEAIPKPHFIEAVQALVAEEYLASRRVGSERPLVRRNVDGKNVLESDLMADVGEWLGDVWLTEYNAPGAI